MQPQEFLIRSVAKVQRDRGCERQHSEAAEGSKMHSKTADAQGVGRGALMDSWIKFILIKRKSKLIVVSYPYLGLHILV